MLLVSLKHVFDKSLAEQLLLLTTKYGQTPINVTQKHEMHLNFSGAGIGKLLAVIRGVIYDI